VLVVAQVPDGLPPGAFKTPYDIGMDEFTEKPWRHGLDVNEFFNYGLNERTWLVCVCGLLLVVSALHRTLVLCAVVLCSNTVRHSA
jgi:hypothetical protein